ncbi:MAG: hypothetical protein IPM38_12190 [Ignavibacteria bacterium]|nr:hypothetical protein [Ignavibacteria bacterium]
MKKLIYSILFMSFMFVIFIKAADAGDRKVIIERFTSSTCGPCASNNPNLEAFLSTADPSKVKSISYHMNWPAPGNDPMYLINPGDNNTRRTNYGINAIPTWVLTELQALRRKHFNSKNIFNQRTDILSPVTVILTETRTGNTVNSTVKIYCETVLANPNATVHFVISEKLVTYPSLRFQTRKAFS